MYLYDIYMKRSAKDSMNGYIYQRYYAIYYLLQESDYEYILE